MDWIETLHLRSYSKPDSDEAVAAFRELNLPKREKGLTGMVLFRDMALNNDLCIFIHWHGESPRRGKSPLGLQIASAFSEFGKINHCVWAHEGGVLKERKTHHEEHR